MGSLQMKLHIEKDTRYSAGQWRVRDESGNDVSVPDRIETTDHTGRPVVLLGYGPLCANTKGKLVERILDEYCRVVAMLVEQGDEQ